jgi:hypothetical protein
MVSFALLFSPSTMPLEISPLARNQLRISAQGGRTIRVMDLSLSMMISAVSAR